MTTKYDKAWQGKFLCALLVDLEFFKDVERAIHLADFEFSSTRIVYEAARKYYRKHDGLPSFTVLQMEVANAMKGNDATYRTIVPTQEFEDCAYLLGDVANAMTNPTTENTQYFRDNLKDFLASVRLENLSISGGTSSEKVEAAAKINEDISRINGESIVFESAMDEIPEDESTDALRIGTGVFGIDIRTNMGLKIGQEGLLVAGTGVGKAVDNNTLIPTTDGLVKAGDITMNHRLIGKNGKSVRILGIHPQKEDKEVWVVTFKDGRTVRCCSEHLWTYAYESHRGMRERTENTREIAARFFSKSRQRNRFPLVPMNDPVEYSEKMFSLDPYIVGALIGNGCCLETKFTVSSGDLFVPTKIAGILGKGYSFKRVSQKNYSYVLGKDGKSVDLRTLCRFNEIAGKKSSEKRIPQAFLFGSIRQRTDLLNGLLDTDGHISRTKGKVSYETTSPGLVKDILFLVRGLGMQATLSEDNRHEKYTDGHCYRVRIQCDISKKEQLFTHPDKLARVEKYSEETANRRYDYKYLPIVSIKHTEEKVPMTCFTVDAEDHLFLCNDYVVTHNTCGMINFACANALRGLNSLFITLENPATMIKSRFQSIMGNIPASLFSTPVRNWPEDAKLRRRYVNSKEFPFANTMTIADRCTTQQTCADIEAVIAKWKDTMIKRGFSDEQCPIVYVDWLEKIDPKGLIGINNTSNTDTLYQKILEKLGEIGRKNNVVMWTAQQITRKAQRAEVLSKEDIAHSSHALDPLDLCIGLAAAREDVDTIGVGSVPTSENDDMKTAPVCDRKMNASFIKCRESSATGTYCTFYQGPTLKFWANKAYAQQAERIARKGDMQSLIDAMAPKNDTRSVKV